MRKATVLIGKAESGKSWLANNLASLDYKNVYSFDGCKFHSFMFNRCNKNTDCVILDDIRGFPDFNQLMYLVSGGIQVNSQMHGSFLIEPKIIVTLDERWSSDDIKKLGLSFTERIELIEMVNGIGHRVEL